MAMRPNYHTVLAISLSSLLSIISLIAQANSEKNVDKLRGLSLEQLMDVPIVTASRFKETVNDTPVTVIVITRQHILNRRYVSLIDLLEDLPGFDVQRGVEDVRYHNITMRGHQGNNRFLILQDGMRIDSPTGEVIPMAENFPLYHAQQVEVLYGPAAAVYGADASGGVINIITQNPEQVDGVRLSGTAGSDNYRYVYVHAGKELVPDKLSLVVGAHRHQSDNADLASTYPDLYPDSDAKTFDGDVIVPAAQRADFLAPTESQSFFAKMVFNKALTLGYNRSFFQSLTSVGVRPETTLYNEDAKWNTRLQSLYLNYTLPLGENWQSNTQLEYADFKVSPLSRFNNIFTSFANGYKYSKGHKKGIEQQFNYQITDEHRLLMGLSFADYYSLPRTPDLPFPYNPRLGPDTQTLYYPNTQDQLPIVILDDDYYNYAAYVEWQAHWNQYWSSNIGLRFDRNSRYNSTLNPRLGVVYRPNNNVWIKALYGEAFRAPSVFENLATFGSFSGERNADGEFVSSFFRAPNPNLTPEESTNYELSISYGLQKNLRVSLAGFYTEVENLIRVRSSNTPIQFIPGGEILTTTIRDNLGTEQYYGFDFILNYQKELSSTISMDWWGSYSYIDGESCCNNGIATTLPYVSQHKVKLGATLTYLDRFFVTPKLYWIGETNTNKLDPNDASKRLQAGDYWLMNLHFGMLDVVDQLSLNVDVYNLFDRRYYHAGGESSTTFVEAPQAPRTVLFSLRYAY